MSETDNQPPDSEEPSSQNNVEDSFVAALSVARKIVRRRLFSSSQADASDLEQGIALRIWKWNAEHPEKSASMSANDWESFIARTAYNETNRYFSKKTKAKELPLDEASTAESSQMVAGDSNAELQSLSRFVWQEICQQSLRQKRALLLQNRKLIIYLLTGGITDEELAQSLELSRDEWLEVKTKLPLSDASIARFIGENNNSPNLESAINSIKKARYEARGKLRNITNK